MSVPDRIRFHCHCLALYDIDISGFNPKTTIEVNYFCKNDDKNKPAIRNGKINWQESKSIDSGLLHSTKIPDVIKEFVKEAGEPAIDAWGTRSSCTKTSYPL